MRNKLIIALFAATLPTLALAMPEVPQEGHRGPGHYLFQDLDLSKEQRREIGKLMGSEMRARRDITERYLEKLPDAQKSAMEKEIKASQEKNQNAIRALLNPEQQKTFDEAKKQRETRRAEMAEFRAWKAEKEKNR